MKKSIRKSASFLIAILSLVGMFSAVGHYLPLPDPAFVEANNPMPGKEWFLEQMPRYAERPLVTALHVLPAFLFMLMVPFQLSGRIRNQYPALHRAMGYTFVTLSISIGLTGIAIGIIIPFGGLDEVIASTLIGTGFFISLAIGVSRARQKRIAEHWQWMSRMLAFAFAPVTMRGIMLSGVALLDLSAPAIFGWTMLMGLAVNLLAVELWFRHSRPGRIALQGSAAMSPNVN
jgi:uncharacterized membrane protein